MVSSRPNILFFVADQFRGDTLGCLNHPDIKTPNYDALAANDRFEDLGGSGAWGRRGYILAVAGRREEALAELERWSNRETRPYVGPALIRVGLGEREAAISLLEQANAEQYFWSWFWPEWDPIRDDPRFRAMLLSNGVGER